MAETFSSLFPPRPGRVHEVYGPGAPAFAAIACGQRDGDVIWLVEAWVAERISPVGLVPYCDPSRVLLAEAPSPSDLLAMTEEALRSGAVKTVVAEVTKPLDLKAGRRLQLAAEAGKALGLMLIPEGAGSNAAETRWHCRPDFHEADSTRMHWALKKNKRGTMGAWTVRWHAETHRIAVVSPVGDGPGAEA